MEFPLFLSISTLLILIYSWKKGKLMELLLSIADIPSLRHHGDIPLRG